MTSEEQVFDGDAIEKYNKGVTRVENILNLHKLRQRVLLEEKLATVGRSDNSLKKYASTPNLFNANRTVRKLFLQTPVFYQFDWFLVYTITPYSHINKLFEGNLLFH